MLRVGILGLGVIAPIHMAYILQHEELLLAAACDLKRVKKEMLPEGCLFYEDYRKMLDEAGLDVIHCCLPHYLHSIAAREAAERKIAVFCEKPMAADYEAAVQMAGLEEQYEVPVGICLQNRSNPSFLKLKEILDTKEYGEVKGIKGRVDWYRPASYYEAEPWRGSLSEAGSGCILNQAIHTLDLMTLLKDELPLSCRGMMLKLSGYPIEVEDTAAAAFIYADGSRSYFSASVVNHSNEPVEITVLTESGTQFVLRGSRLFSRVGEREELLFEEDVPAGEKFYYGLGHERTMDNFYRSLLGREDLYIHPAEALPAMTCYEALRLSALGGGKEVFLADI